MAGTIRLWLERTLKFLILRRSEADGGQDDLPVRSPLCPREGFEGAVDDAHFRTAAAHLFQAEPAAGHTQHVAVGAEHDTRQRRQMDHAVYLTGGGHTDRATGAATQGDVGRQQTGQAATPRVHGMRPADFHEDGRLR
jgi:hypothetical protein